MDTQPSITPSISPNGSRRADLIIWWSIAVGLLALYFLIGLFEVLGGVYLPYADQLSTILFGGGALIAIIAFIKTIVAVGTKGRIIAVSAALVVVGVTSVYVVYLLRAQNEVEMLFEKAIQEQLNQDQTASWKTYQNEEFGFTLNIPPEWTHYIVDKEVIPAGSEFVYGSGKKSQYPWTIYNLGIKGGDLGPIYNPEQTYSLLTIIVFETSDAKKLNIQSEIENTFTVYKFVPTATKYFVLYKGICQDCADGEPFTEFRKRTNDVIETFRVE